VRELARHREDGLAKLQAVGRLQIVDARMPACWVAMRTNESLVEVSPSIVMRLNDSSAASRTSAAEGRGDHRVGGDEAEHRRHVRRIMPAPLLMPVT
jgi:hypothetical protein